MNITSEQVGELLSAADLDAADKPVGLVVLVGNEPDDSAMQWRDGYWVAVGEDEPVSALARTWGTYRFRIVYVP